jgi:hypothetical protein
LQGDSTVTATNLIEIDAADPQVTGTFTLTSLSDGSELFGNLGFSFIPLTANTANVFRIAQFHEWMLALRSLSSSDGSTTPSRTKTVMGL